MKRTLPSILLLLLSIFLTACTYQREMRFDNNLTRENWMCEVETDTTPWTRGADAWFLTGDAHELEMSAVPPTIMKINAPQFSNIKINGDFEVQIFGTSGKNTVYAYGPSKLVDGLLMTVKGDTLYVSQRPKWAGMNHVIIRIGINRLNNLVHMGRGKVEGIRLRGDSVSVISFGSGNVYLAGYMNVRLIRNGGRGCVNVFGAISPSLDIVTSGTGSTNVSGNIGVRIIRHWGANNINVIGANSDHLNIDARGSGKIGISGIVNLCEVKARGNTRVFVSKTSSGDLHAYAYDNARIGLLGVARNFYLDACNNSCVSARALCADTVYVRVYQRAHANVAAWKTIFASSSGSSSIYYFGPSNDILTQFVSDHGLIIPVGNCSGYCQAPRRELVGAG